MARGRTETRMTRRYEAGGFRRGPDELIVEEPLAIHLDGRLVSTTMRTPGHDFELAAGFCFTEGLLAGHEIRACRYCGESAASDSDFNAVTVDTGGLAPEPVPRLWGSSSSCGICGALSVQALLSCLSPISSYAPWDPDLLARVGDRVAAVQHLFSATGGVHAASAFDRDGAPLVVREDIGRHNAVDKVVGRLLLDGELPARDRGLFVSGRASFEIVQKAWAAGFEAVVAVSAPSALATETARAAAMTLAGFARGDSLRLYSEGAG